MKMQKSDMVRGDRPDWYRGIKTLRFGDYFGSVSSLAIGETYLTFDQEHIIHRVNHDTFNIRRNACAHAGAPLLKTSGVQDVSELRCPVHKWQYNVADGKVIAAPKFKICPDMSLQPVEFSSWNGFLTGYRHEEVESGLGQFGASLGLSPGTFDASEFHFVGEEHYPLPYPRELMMINYFDGYHVPLFHGGTFDAVADCDSYEWEFPETKSRLSYSIQLVKARRDVERHRTMLMKVHNYKEEDLGWATFHLWIKNNLVDIPSPIDPEIFAVWAAVYGNGYLMPELYGGGRFLAVSYLVNEDPDNPETGNANLVEYYVHKSVPAELRTKAARMFRHAYEQSAREDDKICEILWGSHRRGNMLFDRVYHEALEAGDPHWHDWYLREFAE